VLFGVGAVATGLTTFAYNAALTGDPRTHPIMAYADKRYGPNSNALGFGPERGLGWTGLDPLPGHGPLDVLINSNLNLFALNVELFGWGSGSVLLLGACVLAGRTSRGDGLMLAVIAVIVGLHALYWFSGGPDFGARYWFLVLVPCAALAARGTFWLGATLAEEPAGSWRALAGVGLLSVVALTTFVPWRAIDKYHHYRGMRPDLHELARTHGFGRDLILVAGRRHPDYASAAALNSPDLRDDQPLYAWDQSPEVRQRVRAAFPDRRAWLVAGPTVTGAGYQVVGGPLPPLVP
jgi:hypothetical protein